MSSPFKCCSQTYLYLKNDRKIIYLQDLMQLNCFISHDVFCFSNLTAAICTYYDDGCAVKVAATVG